MRAATLLEQTLAQHPHLWRPRAEPTPASPPARWSLAALAGRLVELSSGADGAAWTVVVSLVAAAQRAAEPVAWITAATDGFYPPDVVTHGVDLSALAVVRVPEAAQVPRAAARLGHSGAFGLLVLALGPHTRVPEPELGRLVNQATQHHMTVLCLTDKPPRTPSLGSLVSLRAQVRRRKDGPDAFACEVSVLKDKRQGPDWRHEEGVYGPPGLR